MKEQTVSQETDHSQAVLRSKELGKVNFFCSITACSYTGNLKAICAWKVLHVLPEGIHVSYTEDL